MHHNSDLRKTPKTWFDSRHSPGSNGCWIWKGAPAKSGYGVMYHKDMGGSMLAHRASYTLHKGPIPEGMLVCHTCDVRTCVNPAHLFLGTHKDNTQDKIAKGRDWVRDHRLSIAKLSEQQALEIILDTKSTIRALGKKYNLAYSSVQKIRKRVTWKYLHKLVEEGKICGVTV